MNAKELIFKTVQTLRRDREVAELRMPDTPKGTISGYYDDFDKTSGGRSRSRQSGSGYLYDCQSL